MGRRLARRIGALLPDLHVYAGLAAVVYGAAQIPFGIGAIAAPVVLGLGLIWIVRVGAEPVKSR